MWYFLINFNGWGNINLLASSSQFIYNVPKVFQHLFLIFTSYIPLYINILIYRFQLRMSKIKYQSSDQFYSSNVNTINPEPITFNSEKSILEESRQRESVNTNSPPNHQHLQEYQQFFQEIESSVDDIIKQCLTDTEWKKYHKLVILNEQNKLYPLISLSHPQIYILDSSHNGRIIKYQIIIGQYKFSIDMLNVNKNIALEQLEILGEGTYGQVFQIMYTNEGKSIACKRIQISNMTNFNKQSQNLESFLNETNREQLNQILYEYVIYKICSFFKIGPCISNYLGFDLVYFLYHVQFYMEQCIKVNHNCSGLQRQLKTCLRLLHKIKIIHKDIKPKNFLYSTTFQSIVLNDFGISHLIIQKLGMKTLTYKQGTYSYMSQQMVNLKPNKLSAIDLYYNDMIGLKLSLEQLNNLKVKDYKKLKMTVSKKFSQLYMQIKLYYLISYGQQEQLMKYIIKNKLMSKLFEMEYEGNWEKYHLIKKKISILYPEYRNKYSQNYVKQSSNQLQPINLIFFIRAYGLNQKLLDQLSQYKQTSLISNLKYHIQQNQKLKSSYFDDIENGKLLAFKEIFRYKNRIERRIHQLSNIYNQGSKRVSKEYIQCLLELVNLKLKEGAQICKIIQISQKINAYSDLLDSKQILTIHLIETLINDHKMQGIYHIMNFLDSNISIQPSICLNYIILFMQYYFLLEERLQLNRLYAVFFKYSDWHSILQFSDIVEIQLKKISWNIKYFQNYDTIIHRLQQIQVKIITNLGSKNDLMCFCLQQFANFYEKSFYYKKAIEFYSKEIRLRQQIYGDNQPNIGLCYLKRGKCEVQLLLLQKALVSYETGLQKIEKFYGSEHYHVAFYYKRRGLLQLEKGNYRLAIKYYERSYQILAKCFGKNHRYTRQAYSSIGQCYCYLKEFQKSLNYVEDLKNCKKQSMIVQHYKYLSLYYKLKQEPLHELQITKFLLNIYQAQFMEYYPRFYRESLNLSGIYRKLNQPTKAQKTLIKLIQNLKNNPLQNQIKIQALLKLSHLYYQQNITQLCIQKSHQAIQLYKNQYLLQAPGLIMKCYYIAAICQMKLEKYDEAVFKFEEIERIRVEERIQINEFYLLIYFLIGKCSFELGEYKKSMGFIKNKLLVTLTTFFSDEIQKIQDQSQFTRKTLGQQYFMSYTLTQKINFVYSQSLYILANIYFKQSKLHYSAYYYQRARKINCNSEEIINIYISDKEKKAKAQKLELQILKNCKLSTCCFIIQMIKFYKKLHKTKYIGILTALSKITITSQCASTNNHIFLLGKLYKQYKQQYNICISIFLNKKTVKNQSIQYRLKKLTLSKRINYLRKKLSINF